MPAAIQTQALRKVYPAPPQRRRSYGTPMTPLGSALPGAMAGREILALDGLDLTVAPGEFFGLLGPNGAGKTTTIGILTTRVRPTAGTALVAGKNVATGAGQGGQRIRGVPP